MCIRDRYNNQQRFTEGAKEKLSRWRKIMDNSEEELAYDSEEEYILEKPRPSEKLDYYNEHLGWVPATLNEDLGEMVQIQFKSGNSQIPQTKWIHFDSDCIAPADKALHYYRNHVEYYK
eukprot:TRINITY_DN3623_c0_g1_i5.p1 TRINITY_DN3623_c0_g1~~TRINITY_DN3623_c0_g1_i5.p1  ORF type:complete len:119 (-),score=36.06 TRINITY_DN3623_c0_g1_i5:204-560(-)